MDIQQRNPWRSIGDMSDGKRNMNNLGVQVEYRWRWMGMKGNG
jgi:hypothetical protein